MKLVNKPFTYAEYAMEKYFTVDQSFVKYTSRGINERRCYESEYNFLKINKVVITHVPTISCNASPNPKKYRFKREMLQLNGTDILMLIELADITKDFDTKQIRDIFDKPNDILKDVRWIPTGRQIP